MAEGARGGGDEGGGEEQADQQHSHQLQEQAEHEEERTDEMRRIEKMKTHNFSYGPWSKADYLAARDLLLSPCVYSANLVGLAALFFCPVLASVIQSLKCVLQQCYLCCH